jgi:hypothetical protein
MPLYIAIRTIFLLQPAFQSCPRGARGEVKKEKYKRGDSLLDFLGGVDSIR